MGLPSSSTLSTPTSTLTRQPYLGWRSQVCIGRRALFSFEVYRLLSYTSIKIFGYGFWREPNLRI
jgi:hypothetical protein